MKILDQTPQAIASAVTALPSPIVDLLDVSGWNLATGVIDEFDLEVWAADVVNLTAATLWGRVEVSTGVFRWLSYGPLGHASDGAIALTATTGYVKRRIAHRPRTIAYGVTATLSASVATTVSVVPVREK